MRSIALALVLTACGGAAGETASSASGSGTERARSGYTLHEWGLVRGGVGDTLEAHTIGAGPTADPVMVVLKPVLYFHLEAAGDGVTITRSRVTAVEGEIREHFPVTTATAFPTAVDWGAIVLAPGACTAPFVAPTLAEPPCSTLPPGEPCEAASLAAVVSSDADCVVRGDVASPFLFYRSSTRGLTVPLRGVRLPNGDLEITNDGDLPIPGRLVRIQRSGGAERVVAVDPPAPHATITIPVGASTGGGPAAIGETLRGLGLTDGEIEAFHRAWDTTLFTGGASLDLSLTITLPTLDESILYFLPPALCEHIATIELDPPPTETRRAMAVWTSI